MGTGAQYDEGFYATQREGSLRSARSIVPLVIDAPHPSSVVDVGCGVGTWLKVFREGGIADAWSIDGDYVRRDSLLFPEDAFIAADLAEGVSLDRAFDLAVSVEVAEHIEAERAERFVETLTSLSSAVLFSAAIPRQGGASHVNERWPSYWARIFAVHGYEPLDLFRRRIWDDPNVDAFYAQNLLLYADRGAREEITVPECPPLDIVHPRIWEAGRPPTLRQIVQGAPEALRWSARHHLGRFRRVASRRGRSE